MASYKTPKVERRRSEAAGDGLFAIAPIKKDELVVDYTDHGCGSYVTGEDRDSLAARATDYDLQVDDDLYYVSPPGCVPEDADFINHSCEPNCGIRGSVAIVAMRDIAVGEEITFDYAMTESGAFRMECRCGSRLCRGSVIGTDWRLHSLQQRYRGYFSAYLQRRMFF
jgi:SET domain-containing protein